MTEEFILRDGRRVRFLDSGAKDGKVLVAHHGTPSEAGLWRIWDKAAVELGVRLVSVTRPGYADSDPRPGRSVADVASDVAEVLDRLGIGTFVTVGWSGGGPHALACGAMLPGRCRAAAALASIAPFAEDGLDFFDGMGAENVAEFQAASAGEGALAAWMAAEGEGYRGITAESLFAAFGGLLPPVDRAALAGELVGALAETIRISIQGGFRGWMDDDLAFVKPWGFDLRTIAVPTLVWQGGLDKMVPLGHGRWLAAKLGACSPRFDSREGHISLAAGRERDVIRALLEAAAF